MRQNAPYWGVFFAALDVNFLILRFTQSRLLICESYLADAELTDIGTR